MDLWPEEVTEKLYLIALEPEHRTQDTEDRLAELFSIEDASCALDRIKKLKE